MSGGSNSDNKNPLGESLRAAFEDTVEEGVPEQFRKLIDENLKRAYDDTVNEGVPDRFKDLMEKLKNAKPGDPSGDEK